MESADSAELFRWLKLDRSSETRAKVRDLLNRGADPNVVDEYGNTPLHYAALASFGEDVLQALIAAGGRCGTSNDAGETPLHHAASNVDGEFPQKAFIQTLVACGAKPSAQDTEGNTPLHMAFLPLADSYGISPSGGSFNDFWGAGGEETLRSLLLNGSDPDIKNRAGDSPLMVALKQKSGILGVRTLLTHGADPNTVDAQGTPALVRSVLGHTRFSAGGTDPIPVIQMLIKAGANPNASTPDGATTLHHALDTPDDGSILQTLIDLDANPNAQDRQGETPLHRLVRKPSFASGLLATLIDGGADPCIQNHHGNTPREVARNVAYEDHLPECKQTPGNTSQHLHAEFECRVTPEDPGCPSECMDIIPITIVALLSWYAVKEILWSGNMWTDFMSTEEVCQRWGNQPLNVEQFKSAGEDETVRARMACSLLTHQSQYIGKDVTDIYNTFGPAEGYYVSEGYPAYLIETARTRAPDSWQIVFLADSGWQVSAIVVHRNCCDRSDEEYP